MDILNIVLIILVVILIVGGGIATIDYRKNRNLLKVREEGLKTVIIKKENKSEGEDIAEEDKKPKTEKELFDQRAYYMDNFLDDAEIGKKVDYNFMFEYCLLPVFNNLEPVGFTRGDKKLVVGENYSKYSKTTEMFWLRLMSIIDPKSPHSNNIDTDQAHVLHSLIYYNIIKDINYTMDNIIDYEIGLSVKDGYPFSIEYTKEEIDNMAWKSGYIAAGAVGATALAAGGMIAAPATMISSTIIGWVGAKGAVATGIGYATYAATAAGASAVIGTGTQVLSEYGGEYGGAVLNIMNAPDIYSKAKEFELNIKRFAEEELEIGTVKGFPDLTFGGVLFKNEKDNSKHPYFKNIHLKRNVPGSTKKSPFEARKKILKICNNDKLNLRNIIIPGRKQKKLSDGRVLPEIPKIKLCANPLYYPLLLFNSDNKQSVMMGDVRYGMWTYWNRDLLPILLKEY